MDELTQQNAALVEEATAASQSLADQSRDLNQLMERYNTGASERPAVTRRSESASSRHKAPAAASKTKTDSKRRSAGARAASVGTAAVAATIPVRKASGDDGEWQEF